MNQEQSFDIEGFLNQTSTHEGFITGPGGSGKTELLIGIVETLNRLQITYQVVTFTHKAKEVIEKRVPNAPCRTLHSWLKKRPGVNSKAEHINALVTSKQYGIPEPLRLLIVDEFSMVSEADYLSIGEMVDPEMNGSINLYTLYIGDLSQLSPVKGVCTIYPEGDWWLQLTKVYRNTNDLQIPLQQLRDMIEYLDNGVDAEECIYYLEPTENFHRGIDIIKEYMKSTEESKVLLAYTNEAVQKHNVTIQGYEYPKVGDTVFNSTTKQMEVIKEFIDKDKIDSHNVFTPNGTIDMDTKYNPLKTLKTFKFVDFVQLESGIVIAMIFGSFNNKKIRENVGNTLVNLNKEKKDSTKAYKNYKCLNDYVCTVDFPHCITTHKTQGSEWDYVYVDSEDYERCFNVKEKLKLLYVGISRASKMAYLNT